MARGALEAMCSSSLGPINLPIVQRYVAIRRPTILQCHTTISRFRLSHTRRGARESHVALAVIHAARGLLTLIATTSCREDACSSVLLRSHLPASSLPT